MTKRTLSVIFNVGIFVLLLILVLQAADMRRSLRRMEHEERGLAASTRQGQRVDIQRFPVVLGWSEKAQLRQVGQQRRAGHRTDAGPGWKAAARRP